MLAHILSLLVFVFLGLSGAIVIWHSLRQLAPDQRVFEHADRGIPAPAPNAAPNASGQLLGSIQ